MKKVLVLTPVVSGHNLEYLHHIYEGAVLDRERCYVFAVPEEFRQKRSHWDWHESENVQFHHFDASTLLRGNLLTQAWRCTKLLRRLSLEYGVCQVILLSLMDFLPFISVLIPSGVHVSGIIYKIYYHQDLSWSQSIAERLKLSMLAKSRCVKSIFVLNDKESTHRLNQEWGTTKFAYLPDPYVPFDENMLRDMRPELGIAADETMVLHLGSITQGKGSDRIFDMIDRSSEADLRNYCFVFAGVIAENIRAAFYERYNESRKKAHIVLREGFLSYEDMGSLVRTADKVVLPYRRVAQSSGIIAYCAQLGTPVYVPNKGLIGKLVKDYQIGLALSDFRDIHSIEQDAECTNRYCKEHTTTLFSQTILQG